MAIKKLTPPFKYELLTSIKLNQILNKENLVNDGDRFPAYSHLRKYNRTSGQFDRTKSFFYYNFAKPADSESYSKIAKILFLQRISEEMSLQFTRDHNIRPLVSLSYLSSDEDMEIDAVSVTNGLDNQDIDDDIQVLACYRESVPYPPQLVAGRTMTTELTQCLNDLSLSHEDLIDSNSTVTEPSQ